MRRVEVADPPRFPGGGGSNRDPRAHAAIVAAAASLFEADGYEHVTMEGIARRAGVGKPTLYRWWKNKAALAHEVMLSAAGTLTYVDSGNLDDDLEAFVAQTVRFFDVPLVQATWPGAIAELHADPAAWQLAYDTFSRPALDHLRVVLRKAVERGECRPDVDVVTVFDMITGACMSTVNTPGRPRPRKARVTSMLTLLQAALAP